MAATDDPTLKKEKKEKKEKKDKKRKSTDLADAEEPKKEKKEKKRKSTAAADSDDEGDKVMMEAPAALVKGDAEAEEEDGPGEAKKVKVEVPVTALVPFANPLCDDKSQKKVLKGVKKAAKSKALKRGVKEVVKAVRKSPPGAPSATANPAHTPPGLVVLAADISPLDVISHLPVLCEDHNIPYVYVPSRAELGSAGSTKRPTSVVMVMPRAGKGAPEEGREEWEAQFGELYRVCLKLGQGVKV